MPLPGSRSPRPRRAGLFSFPEMLRLVSAILLLGLLISFYQQFRANKIVDDAAAPRVAPQPGVEFKETIIPIADSDGAQDSLEKDAFREEAEAIVDKKPYMAEEMASYWRLFRWARAESSKDLEARARHDIYFTHLFQDPKTFRGQLISLRVHVRQVIPQPDLPENSANAKLVYEAHAVTDESRSNPYILVFPDKHPNLPLGPRVHEEATFVGFFHKLVTYEEQTGTQRAAPVLIGRLNWMEDPVEKGLKAQEGVTNWVFIGVFALIAIVVGSQWWFSRSQKVTTAEHPLDEQAIDRWIESGDIPEDKPQDLPWQDEGQEPCQKKDG